MKASILKLKARSFIFLFAVVTIAAMLLTAPTAKMANAEMKPAVIIDVRTPAEFAAGHIKGAINIPVDRIGQDIESVKGIDKNSLILLYCRSGSRSETARQILIKQGYTQVVNGGGLEDMAKKYQACYSTDC